MKTIAVLFANGTEEIEALTVVDLLRRTDAKCDVVSVSGKEPKGSHNIIIKADKLIEDVDLAEYDCVVIPGGMPGATNISSNTKAMQGITQAIAQNKLICAICASPSVVLAKNGLLKNIPATCYPAKDFVASITNYTASDVEVYKNFITADGPLSAMKFALAICQALSLTPKL